MNRIVARDSTSSLEIPDLRSEILKFELPGRPIPDHNSFEVPYDC